ncbi:DMT family transporter [Halospeciosus flavus]|uniref:DMT family transporter n=1 Tax=Halospeciosus flavus TaxID=3032283 RepID=A0ABD5Z143_9EURY|nr:DMT family transporter [Halospeciosus flavus]
MLGVAVAIAAVSTSAILVRWSGAPSVVKAFYRVLFMTAAIAPFALRDVDDLRAISGRDLGFAVVSGLALAVHFASFFESLEWTSVAASVTLITTQPIFVGAGAAVLLDERLTPRMVGGMAVALVGAFCMSIGPIVVDPLLGGGDIVAALTTAFAGSSAQLYGNALALVGAVVGAVYTLSGRSLRQRLSLFAYTFVVYAVCTAALGAIAVGSGAPLLGYSETEWGLFLAMALLPGMFGHTVINWALKYVESSVVSVSLLGEPVGSTILALVLLGEVPEVVTVLGGAVVLVGIFVTTRARAT